MKVDTTDEELGKLADEEGVSVLPTFKFYKDGKEVPVPFSLPEMQYTPCPARTVHAGMYACRHEGAVVLLGLCKFCSVHIQQNVLAAEHAELNTWKMPMLCAARRCCRRSAATRRSRWRRPSTNWTSSPSIDPREVALLVPVAFASTIPL